MPNNVFIGRSRERIEFNRVLGDLVDRDKGLERPYVTLLYGNGGIGKTTLLKKLMELEPSEFPPYPDDFHHIRIDWEDRHKIHDLENMNEVTADAMLDALCAEIIYSQPYWKNDFKAFYKINQQKEDLGRKFEKLAQKDSKFSDVAQYLPKAGFSAFVSLLFQDPTGLVAAGITAASSVLEDVIDEQVSDSFKEQVNEFRKNLLPKLNSREIDLMHNHLSFKIDALGTCLDSIAKARPIIIALDTYERIDKADFYLQQVIKAASTRVVWIIAGRQNIYKNREFRVEGKRKIIRGYEAGQGYDFDVEAIEVSKFAEQDVAEYFEAYSSVLPDDDALTYVYDVTRGIPLAVKTAAEIWRENNTLDDIGLVLAEKNEEKIVKAMVERYLLHCVEEEDEYALYALAFSEGNKDTLRLMLNKQKDDLDAYLTELAQKYATVYKDEYSLHDEPAEFFRDNLRDKRSDAWVIEFNERVVRALMKKLESDYMDLKRLEKRCEDDDWISDNLSLIKHMMWLDDYRDECWQLICKNFVDNMLYGDYRSELLKLVQSYIVFFPTRYANRVKLLNEANNMFSVSSKSIEYLQETLAEDTFQGDYRDERVTIVNYQIGSLYHWNDKTDSSKRYLDSACKQMPKDCSLLSRRLAERLNSLGVAYYHLDQYEDSMLSFKKSFELRPDDAQTLTNLGAAYRQSGQNEEAIDVYRRSLKLRPDDAGTLYNLGIAYNESGQNKDAIEAYKESLKLRPDDIATLTNLGAAYNESGQNKDAIEAYKKSLKLRPDEAVTLHNLGNLYYKIGQLNEATQNLEKAYLVDKNFGSCVSLAGCFRQLNQIDKHEEYMEKARQMDFEQQTKYNKACFYSNDSNVDEALKLLTEDITERPYLRIQAKVDPDFFYIKDDPRFQKLVNE